MILLAFAAAAMGLAQQSPQPPELKIGEVVERELAGKEMQAYPLRLKGGEFMQVRVEQKGIDVAIKLYSEDGKPLAEMDSPNGPEGFETLSWVAAGAGDYLLKVSRVEEDGNPESGKYSIALTARHATTESDRQRVKAEKELAELFKAKIDSTLESSEVARQYETLLGRYERALDTWRGLKDEYLVGLLEQTVARIKELKAEPDRELSRDREAREKERAAAERRAAREALKPEAPQLIVPTSHTMWIASLAFSPDGRLLATTGVNEAAVKLWDVETGRMLRALMSHEIPALLAVFSPDGALLASGSVDGSIRLWDVRTGTIVRTLRGHKDFVASLAFSPNGKFLVSGGARKEAAIRVWEVGPWRRLRDLGGHADSVYGIAFSRDGKRMASGSADGTVRLWDTASWEESRIINSLGDRILSVAFSPDGKTLASGGDHSVKLWDAATGLEAGSLAASNVRALRLTFSPDGRLLLSSDGVIDHTIKTWDVATGRKLETAFGRDFGGPLAFSPKRSNLLACADHKEIRLWDFAAGHELKPIKADTHAVSSTVFSPDAKLLASVIDQLVGDTSDIVKPTDSPHGVMMGGVIAAISRNLTVKLCDATTGQVLRNLSGNYFLNSAVVFSPDGKLLATGGPRYVIKIWDVGSGRLQVSLTGHTDAVSRVAFSPDGSMAASVSLKEVILWDVARGQQLTSFGVRDFFPVSLAFSPDGKLLAGGALRETRVWEVPSGRPLHILPGHAEFINMVSFSPNGEMLLTGSYDDEPVLLWDLASDKMVGYDRLPQWAERVELPRHTDNEVTTGVTWVGGKRVAARPTSGQIDFVDTDTSDVLASLVMLNDADWMVTTPEGFFDGSPEAWRRLRWRFNGDTFDHGAVELYFNDFFYPNLLQEALSGNPPKASEGRELGRVDRRQPTVVIASVGGRAVLPPDSALGSRIVSDTRTASVVIEVADNVGTDRAAARQGSSGAQDLRLFRNGSLVRVWHDDLFKLGPKEGCRQFSSAAPNGPRRVRCRADVRLVAGDNTFTAYAFNGSDVKSEDATIMVGGADALKREGKLYVLAIGVNKYTDKSYDLSYAVPDIVSIGTALEEQQGRLRQDTRLKQYSGVEVITLADEDATKQNILLALRCFTQGAKAGVPEGGSAKLKSQLAKIKRAEPEDALIIYFAGHGTSRGGRFYFLPHDFGGEGDEALDTRGLSDAELSDALEKVDVGRMLVVIDACQSGQALGKSGEGRAPMKSKGLAQLAYDKGMYILAAAQSQQSAMEGVLVKDGDKGFVQSQNGLLTYALLRALTDRSADKDDDEKLVEREWLDYAVYSVPRIQFESLSLRSAKGNAPPLQGRAKLGTVEVGPVNVEQVKSALQSPRIFYRREAESHPLILARF
jgi:WD40 repeat protein/uncharacterized caspase-like protein